MNYNKIRKTDISNGPGIRVSIFFQGCSFHCFNCFNKETWPFDKGKNFNDDVIDHILSLCDKSYISGISILGGEPMHPKNIQGTLDLVKRFKHKFKDKTVWVWSGYLYDYISKGEIINYIDVLVDGKYEDSLKDPRLKYCGSSNQRVIDVKKSLKKGKIELYKGGLISC